MTEFQTQPIDEPRNAKGEHFTSNITDAKGRVEGVDISTWEQTYETVDYGDGPGQVRWCTTVSPGYKYCLHMQKTKDGKSFGSTQKSQFFETDEERERSIAKRKAKAGIK